jgi:putative transposase
LLRFAFLAMKELNGNKARSAARPHASFNKYTSHMFQKDLRANHPAVLALFEVDDPERRYRIWQRDPMAVLMDSQNKVEQKITWAALLYMHNNPLQEHWNLANQPENYLWSSARFYETGVDEFGLLTHYPDRFKIGLYVGLSPHRPRIS